MDYKTAYEHALQALMDMEQDLYYLEHETSASRERESYKTDQSRYLLLLGLSLAYYEAGCKVTRALCTLHNEYLAEQNQDQREQQHLLH